MHWLQLHLSGAAISTDLQTISYNSQNKATEISEDVNSYNIVYGADGERIKSQLYNNSVLSKTKYYAPGYEKITTTAGTVENHYISSPYGLEAIIVKAGTSETIYLAETDHLGSLIGLTDTAGVYVEKYSYDPWGRRRNPSDWSFNNVPAPTITDRGFTGHEHLDIFGLINMNGRLYDPVTGRFLNADPVIDNTGGAQGLNSYTYCLNNPLKFTDPSGYILAAPPEEMVILNADWLKYAGYHYSSSWFDYEFLIGSGGLSRATTNTQDKITHDPDSGEYVHSNGTVASEEELDALINGNPSGDEDEKLKRLYGWSIDVVIADGGGYGIEFGEIYDPNTGKYVQFFSHGAAYGFDNSGGVNFILITPKKGFKLTDLKGNGWGWSAGFTGSYGRSGNSTLNYPEATRFDTYTLNRIGVSAGPGIFNNAPSSSTYINITNSQMFHFVWPGRIWY